MNVAPGPFARWEDFVVIQQPNYNALADLLGSSDGKRRISRTMLYAIVAAGLLHAGLAYYLYKQRMSVPSVESTDGPVITIAPRYHKPPPPPPEHSKPIVKQTQPPPTTPLHRPPNDPVVQPTDKVELGPVVKGDSTNDRPFATPTPQPPGPPSPRPEPVKAAGPPIIIDPQWLSRPTPEQMSAVYPSRATNMNKSGRVSMQCSVLASGKVAGCAVATEDPAGYGFGGAALRLARYFKMSPQTRDGAVIDGAHVTIRLAFRME